MQFTWQTLVDRARVYIDDDHDDTEGFLSDTAWLALCNAEYSQLYRRWVRSGLVTPAITQSTLSLTSGVATVNGVLAVVGVAEDMGSYMRLLAPAQPSVGREAFWLGSTESTGTAVQWAATGSGDNLSVELYPHPSTGTYVIRHIPTVAYSTALSQSVEVPYGADERMVLGLARRANVKGRDSSMLIERLINDADAELNFTAFSRVGGLRVRDKRGRAGFPRGERFGDVFPANPGEWLFV